MHDSARFGTMMYYPVRVCTTRYGSGPSTHYSGIHGTISYCDDDSVLHSTVRYYSVLACATKTDSVLHGTSVRSPVRFCPTRPETALSCDTLYYKVRLCTARPGAALPGAIVYYKV